MKQLFRVRSLGQAITGFYWSQNNLIACRPHHEQTHRNGQGRARNLNRVQPNLTHAAVRKVLRRLGVGEMRGRALKQELKTISIVVSAALVALFVHYALDQAQAAVGTFVMPSLPALENVIPVFG